MRDKDVRGEDVRNEDVRKRLGWSSFPVVRGLRSVVAARKTESSSLTEEPNVRPLPPMRRKDKAMSGEAVEKVLKSGRVCRLAMITNRGPYLVPLSYGYKDGMLYFHGAREGRKIDALKTDPRVWFEISTDVSLVKGKDPWSWTMAYRCVMGEGTAEFVTDAVEKEKALDILMRQFGSKNHFFPPEEVKKTGIFRVRILAVSGKRAVRDKT